MDNNMGFTTRAIRPSNLVNLENLVPDTPINRVINPVYFDLDSPIVTTRRINPHGNIFEQPAIADEAPMVYDRDTGTFVPVNPSPSNLPDFPQGEIPQEENVQNTMPNEVDRTQVPIDYYNTQDIADTYYNLPTNTPDFTSIPTPQDAPLASYAGGKLDTEDEVKQYQQLVNQANRYSDMDTPIPRVKVSPNDIPNPVLREGVQLLNDAGGTLANLYKVPQRLGTGVISSIPMAYAVGVGANKMVQPWNPLWKMIDTPDNDLMRRQLLYEFGTKEGLSDVLDTVDKTSPLQPKTWTKVAKGEMSLGEGIDEARRKLVEYPEGWLDIMAGYGAVAGTVGKVGKLANIASKTGKVSKAVTTAEAVQAAKTPVEAVENLHNLTASKVSTLASKSEDLLTKISNFNLGDIAKAVESAETGTVVVGKVNEVKELLRRLYKEFNIPMIKQFAPQNLEDTFSLVAKQMGVRQGLGNFNQVEKALNVYLENPEIFSAPTRLLRPAELRYNLFHKVTGLNKSQVDKLFGKLSFTNKELEGIYGRCFKESGAIDIDISKIKNSSQTLDAIARHEVMHNVLDTLEKIKAGIIKVPPEIAAKTNAYLDKVIEMARPFGNKGTYALTEKEHEIIAWAVNKMEGLKVPSIYDVPMMEEAIKFFKNDFLTTKGTERTLTSAGRALLENSNDPYAKLLLKAKDAYDKGLAFPVTHAEAGVDRLKGLGSDISRSYAGQLSQRVLGEATYEEIAKVLKNPNQFLQKQIDRFTESGIVQEIKDGALKGEVGAKGTAYVSQEALDRANTPSDVVNALSEVPTEASNIPINKDLLLRTTDYVDTIRNFGNPFKEGIMKDWYNLGKSIMLGSGRYLAGNIASGATNALVNSNIMIINDAIDSLITRGTLSKTAGTYRRLVRLNDNIKTPVIREVQKGNSLVSNMFNTIDAKQQNFWSEVAINANLREKGIPVGQRLNYLTNAEKITLANIIRDAQDVAALQTGLSIIPKTLRPAVAAVHPFYRWTDSALRSTSRMWQKHPLIMNTAFHHVLGNIAFDQEMQHRLDIKADLDKPYTHITFNPKTGRYRDISADFSAQTTALKFLGSTATAIQKGDMDELFGAGKDINPIGFAAFNVFKGLDKYGRPIKRDKLITGEPVYVDYKNNMRYKLDASGNLQPIKGQADEILNAAATEMLVYPKLYNQTLSSMMQVSNAIMGNNLNFYQPEGSRLFGSFDPAVANVRTGSPQDLEKAYLNLQGMYSSPEYEYPARIDKEAPTGRERRRIIRSRGRQVNRNLSNINLMMQGGAR